jgi:hypothetical protein
VSSHRYLVCFTAGKPDGSPAKPLWCLHEAVEIMADTYCGTLSLEYKHLQQQDEMAWMQQRFESRRPLTGIQKRQVRCKPSNTARACLACFGGTSSLHTS